MQRFAKLIIMVAFHLLSMCLCSHLVYGHVGAKCLWFLLGHTLVQHVTQLKHQRLFLRTEEDFQMNQSFNL